MATIAQLITRLDVDSSRFNRELDKANRKGKSFAQRMSRDIKKGAVVMGAATTAAAGAVAVLTQRSIDNQDATIKMARSVGTTAEQLSTLTHAAQLGGVSQDELAKALGRAARVSNDAANGLSTAQRTYDQLGISVNDASGKLKSSDQIMLEVADRFAGMEDGARKTALAQELFGRSGAKLIPMLNQGADGIRAMQQEARDLGLEINTNTAIQAEQFNDTLTRLRSVGTGFSNALAANLLPTLNNVAGSLFETTQQSDAMSQSAEVLGNFVRVLASGGLIVKGVFDRVANTIAKSAAVIASIASGEFRQAWNIIQDDTGSLRNELDEVFSGIEALWDTTAGNVERQAPKTAAALVKPMTLAADKMEAEKKRMAEAQKGRDVLAGDLDRLRESLMSEEQLIRKSMADRLQIAIDSRRANLLDEQQFASLQMQIQLESAARLEELTLMQQEREGERRTLELESFAEFLSAKLAIEQGYVDTISTIEGAFHDWQTSSTEDKFGSIMKATRSFTATSAGESKKMFKLNQNIAVAQALVSTYQGAAKALEWGWPLGPIFAGVMVASGLAQVANIRSQSFSGGGGGGGGGVSTAASTASVSTSAANANLAQGGGGSGSSGRDVDRTVTLRMLGATESQRQLGEQIGDALNEALGDGFRLNLVTS
ncbi:MAG: phage tail tape measure protein [Abyssibacter sp.]|uniref:phage tail tape measure protein n=1 Tax=Abyssibacter sp. TaxID=2320200 RepID=UPI00321A2633